MLLYPMEYALVEENIIMDSFANSWSSGYFNAGFIKIATSFPGKFSLFPVGEIARHWLGICGFAETRGEEQTKVGKMLDKYLNIPAR